MVRRNIGTVLIAAAVIVILLVAFILARVQDKLPELALDLIVYLFATTLAVFVIGRMLAWRERRRWIVAKDWLHMILLETIDDLLKELLPAAVPREGVETDEEVTVYEVAGERIHFGETVAYSPLQLSVRPGEKDLQSHILWYASELGPPRYAELARAALSDARARVRDIGNFWSVTRSRHYGHGDEFRPSDCGRHKTCGLGRKHAERKVGRFSVSRWRGIDNAEYKRSRS
jgi:hypothetical protein